MTTAPAIDVRDLEVRYGEHVALEGVTTSAAAGRLTAIVGPNGAGKSTLLKAIMGEVQPARGTIEVFGETGRRSLRRVTWVPQRGAVDADFPVTVLDVVRQGRLRHTGWFRRRSSEDDAAIRAALERVDITDLVDRPIGTLSGGQLQRTFLARALAQAGDLYLLDEPFVGVDAATERAIVAVLRELRDAGAAVVVVHHDLGSVRDLFDDVVLLNRRVVASGPVERTFTAEHLQRAWGGRLVVIREGTEGAA